METRRAKVGTPQDYAENMAKMKEAKEGFSIIKQGVGYHSQMLTYGPGLVYGELRALSPRMATWWPDGAALRRESRRHVTRHSDGPPTAGMVGLGFLSGGALNSRATAVSGDGNLVVGMSGIGAAAVPFIWDQQDGMRPLTDVLANGDGLGTALSRWTLTGVSGLKPAVHC